MNFILFFFCRFLQSAKSIDQLAVGHKKEIRAFLHLIINFMKTIIEKLLTLPIACQKKKKNLYFINHSGNKTTNFVNCLQNKTANLICSRRGGKNANFVNLLHRKIMNFINWLQKKIVNFINCSQKIWEFYQYVMEKSLAA